MQTHTSFSWETWRTFKAENRPGPVHLLDLIRLSKQGEVEEISIEPDISINDYAAIRAAVLASHGIGELPEPLCIQALQAGHLIEVLPEWSFPEI
ncbi:hypothetical protein So717_29470 [Roseobacter cerasinus]|uniref:LysR substrate-binding domain-containing protein n=1 Tax=Roseobacter cerasinus TaxID=2602289 RepID=A0A640VUC3_9RHOB|nr:LysR substrate-binding domain-containing protein [Roseobacter cerasinus]GFE51194.1 hypothetical protein So717_29470 [Roseobacter cerasinus]